jgi:hypothetical protein
MNNGISFWRKPWMPWACASRLFGPAPINEYDALKALSLVRTILGFSISALIYDHFRAGDQQVNDLMSSAVFTFFISIGLTLLLSMTAAVRSKDLSRETLQPVSRGVMALLVVGGFGLLGHLRDEYSLLGLAASIIFIWYAIFFWVSMVFWYLSPFGSSEKFPFLGPIVTGVTVVAVTVISFISGDGGPLPLLLWIGITLAGLFTALALVAAEIHVLRREIGDKARRSRVTPSDRPRHRRSH